MATKFRTRNSVNYGLNHIANVLSFQVNTEDFEESNDIREKLLITIENFGQIRLSLRPEIKNDFVTTGVRKIHILVLRSFIGPFILTFFMTMFVLILQFLWIWIDELVGKGLEWGVILELIFYYSGNLFMMALPLATLLSSIMAIGNLGEHNELLALKSAGISLPRILAPLMVVACLLAVGGFLFSNNLLPYFNLKATALLFDVKQQRPELQIKEGVFYDGINDYIIRVKDKDEKTGLLCDIMIYDHSGNNGNRSLTIADSGYMRITSNQKYLILTLYNGCSYDELKESAGEHKYPFRINKFSMEETVFELTGYGFERTDDALFKNRSKMLDLHQLSVISDSLQRERDSRTLLNAQNFFRSTSFRLGASDFSSSGKPRRLAADSILAACDVEQQLQIANKALVLAKQAQSSFASQASDMQFSNRELDLHNIEWHLKFTVPLSCILFVLIGAPLGAIIRKGGFGTPFLISLLVFMLYYIVSFSFEKLAKNSEWEPRIAIWMSTIVTLPLAIFFSYKAATDRRVTLPKWYLKVMDRAGALLGAKR
ncbi:MAG: LptF/LptG family permease [Prevotellaceae bacterium]|nr:LptF/LptG family permease [Prevotellaceae bacterium]